MRFFANSYLIPQAYILMRKLWTPRLKEKGGVTWLPRGETLVIEHPFAVGKATNIPQLIKKVLQSNLVLCCAKDFKIRKSELEGNLLTISRMGLHYFDKK